MWKKYLDYLKNWAEEHEDDSFMGNSPASYEEWADNEAEEKQNNSEWFGIVRWCDDDIANAIEVQGYEPTEENIAKVRNAVDTHHFVDWMIENGWEYIYQNVNEELG